MKKLATWMLVEVLWPILREILVEMLKQAIRTGADAFKATMERRRTAEAAAAPSDEAREAVNERFRQRVADLDEAVDRILERTDTVVENALLKSQARRDNLLSAPPASP